MKPDELAEPGTAEHEAPLESDQQTDPAASAAADPMSTNNPNEPPEGQASVFHVEQ